MKPIRKVLAALRRADCEFNLINKDDKIVVGVSGGKDSLLLVHALKLYQNFPDKNFIIQPVFLDLGFPNTDPAVIVDYFHSQNLDLIVEDAREVYSILKIQQKNSPHLPCSICSRMKKAAINKVANKLGFNKVAFAHHADDAIETLFMNEIFGGRIATFAPKMYLENAAITFIRPLIYVRESDIVETALYLELPVMKSPCPSNQHTMREETKSLLKTIYEKHSYAKENFLTMLTNYEKADLWFDELNYKIEGTPLSVREVLTKSDSLSMVKIRHDVFCVEQNIDFEIELDEEDHKARHFLLLENNIPIGTIRYLVLKDEIHLGRLAILATKRKLGYGALFLKFIEQWVHKHHADAPLSLNAQYYLKEFYEKLGFITDGEPFLETSIKHIRMIKQMSKKKQ